MEKKYDHNKIETEQSDHLLLENSRLYQELSKRIIEKTAVPEVISEKRIPANPFFCLLPPPNITGKLHLGHM